MHSPIPLPRLSVLELFPSPKQAPAEVPDFPLEPEIPMTSWSLFIYYNSIVVEMPVIIIFVCPSAIFVRLNILLVFPEY